MKMKTLFFGYYPPQEKDFEAWWKTGRIVFDTNALLDFYGLKKETREQLFVFLESIRERIWIPHQVGFEFSRNRVKVIKQQAGKYVKAIDELKKIESPLNSAMEAALKSLNVLNTAENLDEIPGPIQEVYARLSKNFDELRVAVDRSTAAIKTEIDGIDKALKSQRVTEQDLILTDPILEQIMALFGDNVGDPYQEADLKKIYSEGEQRYKDDANHTPVPPGYMDAKNPDKKGNDKYGDLVLWKQTIDKAKAESEKKPVLMMSHERKPDWVDGPKDGKWPRSELIQEMYEQAGVPFYLFTLKQLMEFAVKYLDARFSNESISDAGRVEQELTPKELREALWAHIYDFQNSAVNVGSIMHDLRYSGGLKLGKWKNKHCRSLEHEMETTAIRVGSEIVRRQLAYIR